MRRRNLIHIVLVSILLILVVLIANIIYHEYLNSKCPKGGMWTNGGCVVGL